MPEKAPILYALRAAADDVAREVEFFPEALTHWRPGPHEWSQYDCLQHLALVERHVFLARAQAIAAQDEPFLPIVDEAALQKQAGDERPRATLVKDYLDARAALLTVLQNTDWARTGQHAARGSISLTWLAEYTLGHTWEHLSQMLRVRLNYAAPVKNE